MDILIIADDLSGAADCAIPFVRAGQRMVVALQPSGLDGETAGLGLAIDADTRRLPSEEAARRTCATYTAHRRANQRLYRKIDSTLRGNWAAELAALRPLAGMAIVAPAYPALGRTVRGGNVYVDGTPLADTGLWKLEHAHRPAAIDVQLQEVGLASETLDADALRVDPAALSDRIAGCAARGLDALIIDSVHEQALRAVALATSKLPASFFWVGSGGLAREIAALAATRPAPQPVDSQPARGPTLVLVGSLSAVTDRQCAVLRASAPMQELVAPPSVLRNGPLHAPWQSLHARIGELLGRGADVLLRIGREQATDPTEGALLSAALARLVGPHFDHIGALIATGGETARAMLAEARIESVELLAELQPGVAAAVPRGTRGHRPYIVTKAGGFGGDDALHAAWSRLRPPSPRHPA